MDFTELYNHSNALVAFSPGAHFILNAIHDRIIVRRADTFQITRTWQVDSTASATSAAFAKQPPTRPAASTSASAPPPDAYITHAAWSSDSEYILAACAKRGIVNIYKMRDELWSARIQAGAEGLVKAEWSPDGRNVLCFSEWGLRVTVWSLVTGAATYIQYPKYPDKGYAFRADGRYLILAERHKSKDTIGIYDAADSFKQARHYAVPMASLSSLSISPTGKHVAIWESVLEYKLCILTLPGVLLATFTPKPDPGLGIRCVAWHPSGSFLAVGGYDDKFYILDSLSWAPIASFELSSKIPSDAIVWREPPDWIESTLGRGFLSYERPQGLQTISLTKADAAKAHPKSGLLQLEWNTSGSLLMARFETAPNALFIYDLTSSSEPTHPRLRSVLSQSQPITHARWNPNPKRSGSLALCCSGGGLYTWSNEWSSEDVENSVNEEEMAECIGIPAKQFQLRDIRWAADGRGLILLDKDTFCCSFEVSDDTGE